MLKTDDHMKKKKPVIEILIVGDEILSNPAQERNIQYIVDTLLASGFKVDFISIVGSIRYKKLKICKHFIYLMALKVMKRMFKTFTILINFLSH